jgi:predicted  nucleic acid-binding Zn-ribbon protein
MLVALGFLLASLIVIALAPAYWARAVRLTTQRIHQTLPLTEGEIRADKDRIRAEYAVRIHKLETTVEHAKLAAARQQVELNRRNAAISVLEREVERSKAALEEHQNARRVLEHTVTDRVVVIEERLAEARRLLEQRDEEVATLNADTVRSVRALDEAMQINVQQRAEIERLTAVLATRAVRNRDALSDPKFDGEVALRSEIEALRAKTRDQADVIKRLQAITPAAGTNGTGHSGGAASRGADGEVERLRRDLAEAEAALRAVRDKAEVGQAGHAALEAQIQALKTTADGQAATIKRLQAALDAYEADGADNRSLSLKESKIAMKSRLRSLQSEVDSQRELIDKLRAELAASNERLALQSAQFRDEMNRLGAGTLPASGQARPSGAARVKRSLAERISQAMPEVATSSISAPARTANGPGAAQAGAPAMTSEPAAPSLPVNAGPERPVLRPPAGIGARDGAANGANAAGEPEAADSKRIERRIKPRLLERISALDKS